MGIPFETRGYCRGRRVWNNRQWHIERRLCPCSMFSGMIAMGSAKWELIITRVIQIRLPRNIRNVKASHTIWYDIISVGCCTTHVETCHTVSAIISHGFSNGNSSFPSTNGMKRTSTMACPYDWSTLFPSGDLMLSPKTWVWFKFCMPLSTDNMCVICKSQNQPFLFWCSSIRMGEIQLRCEKRYWLPFLLQLMSTLDS